MKRWVPRYRRAPQVVQTVPFTWDRAYQNRRAHLLKVLTLNAPEVIIEMACRNMLYATARSHRLRTVVFSWVRYTFNNWCHMKWFQVKWYSCRIFRRWSHEECEHYFFEEFQENPDPEVEELRKMSGLKEEKP